MLGCRVSSLRARPWAAPVAQRTNSSTAAENESDRSSTCSRSSFHDLKPYSRAMTNCASCRANVLGERPTRTAWSRLSAAGSWLLAACNKDFACFLSCSRLAGSGNCCDVIKTSVLEPEVRNQAARDLDVHWIWVGSGLSPSREPAGALSARRLNTTDLSGTSRPNEWPSKMQGSLLDTACATAPA